MARSSWAIEPDSAAAGAVIEGDVRVALALELLHRGRGGALGAAEDGELLGARGEPPPLDEDGLDDLREPLEVGDPHPLAAAAEAAGDGGVATPGEEVSRHEDVSAARTAGVLLFLVPDRRFHLVPLRVPLLRRCTRSHRPDTPRGRFFGSCRRGRGRPLAVVRRSLEGGL